MKTILIGLMSLGMLAAGCIETAPSSGRCVGNIGTRAVDLAMDPGASEFHRDDDILLDDDGPVRMSYGGGAFVIEGEFDDLPDSRVLGTYAVPDGQRVSAWNVRLADTTAPTAQESTLTVTRAASERVVGQFTTRFEGGSSVRCTFDLRRAYELDTDD